MEPLRPYVRTQPPSRPGSPARYRSPRPSPPELIALLTSPRPRAAYALGGYQRLTEWPRRRYLPDACIDLVYLDPPFNSNRDYNVPFRDQSGNRSDAQLLAFEDIWHAGSSG